MLLFCTSLRILPGAVPFQVNAKPRLYSCGVSQNKGKKDGNFNVFFQFGRMNFFYFVTAQVFNLSFMKIE